MAVTGTGFGTEASAVGRVHPEPMSAPSTITAVPLERFLSQVASFITRVSPTRISTTAQINSATVRLAPGATGLAH
jgi:hypothetical protein